MPKRVRRKITKRLVDALAREGKSGVYWDAALPGFGVRVYGAGRLTYVVQSRGPDSSRRAALGRHVDLTPAQVRVTTCLLGLGSRFETAVASVCRTSNSGRKAIGSELRTMPSRETERGLAP